MFFCVTRDVWAWDLGPGELLSVEPCMEELQLRLGNVHLLLPIRHGGFRVPRLALLHFSAVGDNHFRGRPFQQRNIGRGPKSTLVV
jgi:hypothetical protein